MSEAFDKQDGNNPQDTYEILGISKYESGNNLDYLDIPNYGKFNVRFFRNNETLVQYVFPEAYSSIEIKKAINTLWVIIAILVALSMVLLYAPILGSI